MNVLLASRIAGALRHTIRNRLLKAEVVDRFPRYIRARDTGNELSTTKYLSKLSNLLEFQRPNYEFHVTHVILRPIRLADWTIFPSRKSPTQITRLVLNGTILSGIIETVTAYFLSLHRTVLKYFSSLSPNFRNTEKRRFY